MVVIPMLPGTIRFPLGRSTSGTMKAADIPAPHSGSLAAAERALNKLARTFATLVETLKKYRTGGEQRVTVQHVS